MLKQWVFNSFLKSVELDSAVSGDRNLQYKLTYQFHHGSKKMNLETVILSKNALVDETLLNILNVAYHTFYMSYSVYCFS